MEEKQEHKISFFTRLKWAIFNVENYDFFAAENKSKAFGYFAKLILLFSLLICIAITYVFGNYYKQTVDYVKNEMPDFTYEDGKLHVNQEERIIVENEQGTVIIDTVINAESEDAQEIMKKLQNYRNGILLLNDKVMIKSPTSEELNSYSYNEVINQEKFTKTEVVEYINSIPMASIYMAFYITSVIYLFIIYLVATAMDVILLSILGMLTSRMVSVKMKYVPIVNISIYALTLSLLLNAGYIIVNTLTGFEIKYFQIMYNAISYIYMVTAILMIKSEMIKQQIELMKLADEQKKVREELERQEEEEKEKEEQREKEKEDEKRKKEEEQPNSGETPEGV